MLTTISLFFGVVFLRKSILTLSIKQQRIMFLCLVIISTFFVILSSDTLLGFLFLFLTSMWFLVSHADEKVK
jgi:hypothetical protein